MTRRWFLLAVLVIAILGTPILQPLVSSAASTETQNHGQGLEISPPLIDRKVKLGQVLTLPIRLRNITRNRVVATTEIDDFVAAGEDGRPKILDATSEDSPYSFRSWVVGGLPELDLVAGEAKMATIKILVPKDAAPGGHYGVVRFTALPPEAAGSQVALNASIGTLVLLNVSGEVQEELALSDFYASREEKKGTFFEYGPLSFTTRLQNNGNVHVKPEGSIKITNMFGKTVTELPLNETKGSILPGSTRKFDSFFDRKRLFGRYKINLSLTYGSEKALSQTIVVWVIPYKQVLLIITVLALIVLLILLSLRQYKRRIIAQHQRPNIPPRA